jgi:uncharacterized protein (DUF305 family)
LHKHPYANLAAMAALSFVAMYALMYAMVDRPENVIHNVNQVYMAGLMAGPMVLIELMLMRSMYENRRLTLLSAGIALVVAAGCFMAIRRQAAVADDQFLKSMIPHHAAAILMCEQADVSRPRVIDLCRRIVSSQQSEIAEMKALL